MRQVRNFSIWMMLVLVAACAQFQLSSPETPAQRLAYSYSSLTSSRIVTAKLLNESKISVAEAVRIGEQLDSARLSLDATKALLGVGSIVAAEDKLFAVETILTSLANYLKTKE